MASISEKKKNGKVIAYRFVVCLGRDEQKKQIRRVNIWTPPSGLTPAKAKKAAERAADAWEQEIRAEYQKEQEAMANGQAYALPPEKRKDDFAAFVNEIWLPLQVRGGNNKPATVTFYKNNAKMITAYFDGCILQDITPMDIQKYLVYLRTGYKSKFGTPLAPKTTHHLYATLNLIFGYAEKQEMIAKNPMRKVDAPKKMKKPVGFDRDFKIQRQISGYSGHVTAMKSTTPLLISKSAGELVLWQGLLGFYDNPLKK